ncbi:MAG: hypothetical protein AAB225_05825 [Acidobacteriota bacterium]
MRTLCLLLALSLAAAAAPARVISLVVDPGLGAPALHGLKSLTGALEAAGVRLERRADLRKATGPEVIVYARPGSDNVRRLGDYPLPAEPEALLIKRIEWNKKKVLLLCGYDDRALMYAAMEAARQIRLAPAGGDPLEAVREVSEKPFVKERGLSKIVMNQAEFESYFFSEEYWAQYLDMLAGNRFNNFVLMLGYSSAGYMEPPYPFMFDTDGFPGIRVAGIAKEQQARNLEALVRVIRMTHERGMEFTLALWTHIYRSRQETPGLVHGLTDDNLIPYSRAALKKFLALVPGIDRIQFRVHVESSLELPQQIPFWNAIFETIEQSGQRPKIDMRVKGFNDDMIEAALTHKLPVRLATKYWGEQMGLPFHPTHVEWRDQYTRRHSYADLLRYPKRYDMLWRLWNFGTTRVLLWGDPEWVRRFAGTTDLYGPAAFEVSEPLAFKMGHHRGPTYSLLQEPHRYYRWEFERYWQFYQLFGRLGYNPETPAGVWLAEFQRRFGAEAAPHLERALAVASRIPPRINAYNLVDLSADRAWAEKQRWGDLPEYVNAPPSDTTQFVGIAEAARLYLDDKRDARIWPQQTARWFAATGKQVLEHAARAGQSSDKEFASTLIDLKVHANLALYHMDRIHAGFHYALWEQARDLQVLDAAIEHEKRAIATWEKIVQLTDGVYHDNLVMGRGPLLTGHWKDELAALRKGLAELERQRDGYVPPFREVVRKFDFGEGPPEEGFIKVGAKTRPPRYSYREVGHGWLAAYLLPAPKTARGPDYVWGPPPAQYVHSAFLVDLPDGHYELKFTMQDTAEPPRDHGPMWIEVEGRHTTGPFRVPAGQRVEKTLEARVVNNRLGISFVSGTGATWLVNDLIITRVGPTIAHVPRHRARAGRDFPIRATVNGPAPLREVRLVYGAGRAAPMKAAGPFRYTAPIPAAALVDGLSYTIEAEDQTGRRASTAPARVTVYNDDQPPAVTVARITTARAGEPLVIRATATDTSGIGAVRLRYRGLNQYQEFAAIPMTPAGNDEYVATIPAADVDPRWDLMYYVEAFDKQGNGKIYPDLEKETPYVVVRLSR